jgi:hypothetical protein
MRCSVILAGWLVLAVAPLARATTLLALDLKALTDASEVVARGKVLSQHSRWTPDHARIITDVELDLTQVLKGEVAPGKATVMVQGGVVGDIGQKVEGVPTFEVDEDVVLFLEKRGTSRFVVTGMAQGKFSLKPDREGKLWAHPDEKAHMLLLDATTHAPTSRRQGPLRFEELLAKVLKWSGKTAPAPTSASPRKSVP